MTITVEDGTGLSNATSYVSVDEFATYAANRGVTITGTASELLIVAMDYIEQQNFKGQKGTKEQALQWPRYNVWIDGYSVDADEIPTLLKEAQMEAALAVDAGNSPLATIDREVKREKLDTLEIEYMDGTFTQPVTRALSNKLSKLVSGTSGGINVPAIRV